MKTLAWFLSAAVILIGADVFVASSDPASTTETTVMEEDRPVTLVGGNGMPTPSAQVE